MKREDTKLGAYFDGELDLTKLEADKLPARQELEQLKSVQHAVRAWHAQASAELKTKPLNLWVGIERRLNEEEALKEQSWFERFKTGLMDALTPHPVTASLAMACLVSAFAFLIYPEVKSSANSQLTQVALTNAPLRLAPSTRDAYLERVSQNNMSPRYQMLQRSMSSHQFSNRNFVVGGLRTGSGSDIAWVRSPRPFHLVQARNTEVTPVIWVSSR